ncbi:MAG: type II toxin-antitoxin system Phd/YefM family antitoxin [Betaproteobacteria bacterium]|nr:type II toxin-antitoxin system Phd/YefM family antitoxin [Betaproteobacteria bacterium]
MDYVTVREFRTRPAKIWQRLEAEKELVITRNGKPFAVLAFTASNRVEDSLRAIRRARFEQALRVQHQRARAAGLDRVTLKDINAEIAAARRATRGKRTRRP